MEADLAHHYQVDVVDLWRGRITLRRLATLTMQLPAGGQLWQATGGARAWSDTYAGLVATHHGLSILAWQQTEDGQKGKKPPSPAEPPPFYTEVDEQISKADANARKFEARQKLIEAQRASRMT